MRRPTSPETLAGVLAGAGALHLCRPVLFDSMVPRRLGHARTYVYASGVAELAVAAAVAAPATRRTGGRLAAVLFVAVFPANVSMVMDRSLSPRTHRIAWWRLPMQVPLVLWGLRVARRGQPSR